jgi:hypothetical protein
VPRPEKEKAQRSRACALSDFKETRQSCAPKNSRQGQSYVLSRRKLEANAASRPQKKKRITLSAILYRDSIAYAGNSANDIL